MKSLPREALIPLGKGDICLLDSIIKTPAITSNAQLLNECMQMRDSGSKFEFEALHYHGSDYVARTYIPQKILRRDML